MATATPANGDPLRLRELLGRASALAAEHSVASVLVGLAAPDGDLMFPEVLDFVSSALRVDDGIYRMTRERAVLLLADLDRTQAEDVVRRSLAGFRERFPSTSEAPIALSFYEVSPGAPGSSVKDVLPALFR